MSNSGIVKLAELSPRIDELLIGDLFGRHLVERLALYGLKNECCITS